MEIDVLLNSDQFLSIVEDPELYFIPPDMAVLYEQSLSIPASSITQHIESWPKSIAKWNQALKALKAMSSMVCLCYVQADG